MVLINGIDLALVRKLERAYDRAVNAEEECDDLARGWRLAAASDRILANLKLAYQAKPLPVKSAPRTARNLAKRGFEVSRSSAARSPARPLSSPISARLRRHSPPRNNRSATTRKAPS
jgi:hypothetical protein